MHFAVLVPRRNSTYINGNLQKAEISDSSSDSTSCQSYGRGGLSSKVHTCENTKNFRYRYWDIFSRLPVILPHDGSARRECHRHSLVISGYPSKKNGVTPAHKPTATCAALQAGSSHATVDIYHGVGMCRAVPRPKPLHHLGGSSHIQRGGATSVSPTLAAAHGRMPMHGTLRANATACITISGAVSHLHHLHH